MNWFLTKWFSKQGWMLALILILAATPAAAQKNKDKKKDQSPTESQPDPKTLMPDSQAVEQTVGEALGYWQIGDLESLHKYYADDVAVVSGLWEPPVIGWANYAKAYADQRARVTGGRIDRSNTLIKVNGNFAWATYQFVYAATMEGKIAQFHGHTTLVLNKKGDRWVIVLDHSSIVDSSYASTVPTADSGPSRQH